MRVFIFFISSMMISASALANDDIISFGRGQKYKITRADMTCIKLMNDNLNGNILRIKFSEKGTVKFSRLTEKNIGKTLDSTLCGVIKVLPVMQKINSSDLELTQVISSAQKKCFETSKLKKCP